MSVVNNTVWWNGGALPVQHNSFIWEGLDGSQILAHFPPANTYESRADVKDILKTVDEMKDKGRTRDSVLLYGHGDGGGGPTDNMLESLKRMMDVEGCPRIKHSTPELFFSTVESKAQQNLCKWVGELYLELHRGTYTSQAKLKLENRRIEFLLHDVDFISAISRIVAAGENVASFQAEMCQLWKKFLLNQFHDVIPGSCIAQVVTDALELYKDVKAKALTIFHEQFNGIIEKIFQKSPVPTHTVVNSFCWERKEVVRIHDPTTAEATPRKRQKLMADESVGTEQILKDGSVLNYVVSPPMSIGELTKISPPFAASVIKLDDGDYLLENGILKARVRAGLLISLYHKESQREVIDSDKGAGNQFVMFDDIPLFWDAWDVMEYHLETRKVVGSPELSDVSIEEEGPLRAILKVKFAISERSNVTQEIILDAGCSYLKFSTEVSWHESHKFLKVEFPLNVRAHEAKYEVQFGHVSRPTHFNTSWDQARFEVCGHKWADLSEHDFGVALLNDCKYGYSTLDNVMRLSLLRSPKAPDGDCDMGSHTFSYAIIPHKGTLQDSGVIQQAYNFNYPLKPLPSFFTGPASSFLTIDNPAIIIETIKQPEDVSRGSCLVVRVYEAYGGHAAASLTCKGMYKYVRCNLLEQVESDATDYCHGSKIPLKMKPFQVESYIVYIDCGTENMNTT